MTEDTARPDSGVGSEGVGEGSPARSRSLSMLSPMLGSGGLDGVAGEKAPRRRSQRDCFRWQRLQALVDRYWPEPSIRHPWTRTAIRRQVPEVGAGWSNDHVRICAGVAGKQASLPRPLDATRWQYSPKMRCPLKGRPLHRYRGCRGRRIVGGAIGSCPLRGRHPRTYISRSPRSLGSLHECGYSN